MGLSTPSTVLASTVEPARLGETTVATHALPSRSSGRTQASLP